MPDRQKPVRDAKRTEKPHRVLVPFFARPRILISREALSQPISAQDCGTESRQPLLFTTDRLLRGVGVDITGVDCVSDVRWGGIRELTGVERLSEFLRPVGEIKIELRCEVDVCATSLNTASWPCRSRSLRGSRSRSS
jgi:hypothetical protein